MVGLVPTIHVVASLVEDGVQVVDARHRGEQDGRALTRDKTLFATAL
jgi:hypothetical protein